MIKVDVNYLTNKVGVLNTGMVEVKKITDNLKRDIKTNTVISSFEVAFGVVGTVGSVASIGVQLYLDI